MCVTEVSIGLQNMNPEKTRDEMMHHRNEGKGFNAVDQLRLIAGLCNSGEFDASTNNLPLHERKINGDATDQAVLRFAESLGPVAELRQMWKKTFELAFNSKNKYMIRTLELVEERGLEVALPTTEAATFRFTDTWVFSSLLFYHLLTIFA
jgi:sodium/potassium-transporting ATPase subunit alpha